MYPDSSLKENVTHGTKKNPISGIHFTAGKGTPYVDYFFVDRHWHHTVEIIYIVNGNYHFEINLEEHLLSTGDLCFLNSEDLHQITGCGTDAIHDVLIFDPHILDFSYPDELEEAVIAPFLKHELIFPHVVHTSDAAYPVLSTLIRKLMSASIQTQAGWYISSKLLLLELVNVMAEQKMFLPANALLSENAKQKIDRYKQIISYIEEHYSEPVTLQQLADTVSCNSQYLCRFFKEITGISPIQYLINCRIEHACTLLTDTTSSILEISMDCGFENVSYFIRKFKQLKGCTPKEYRKQRD